MRLAATMGLLTVQERHREGQKNLANLVRIISREWQPWIKRGGQRNGPPAPKAIGLRKESTAKDSREEKKAGSPGSL
jgi:hypothetical protein